MTTENPIGALRNEGRISVPQLLDRLFQIGVENWKPYPGYVEGEQISPHQIPIDVRGFRTSINVSKTKRLKIALEQTTSILKPLHLAVAESANEGFDSPYRLRVYISGNKDRSLFFQVDREEAEKASMLFEQLSSTVKTKKQNDDAYEKKIHQPTGKRISLLKRKVRSQEDVEKINEATFKALERYLQQ